LGQAGVNIGTFNLGRRAAGGEAIALVSVDESIEGPVLASIGDLPGVRAVKPLHF
jgi:D-3-phosphoglycerate dehydrogenase